MATTLYISPTIPFAPLTVHPVLPSTWRLAPHILHRTPPRCVNHTAPRFTAIAHRILLRTQQPLCDSHRTLPDACTARHRIPPSPRTPHRILLGACTLHPLLCAPHRPPPGCLRGSHTATCQTLARQPHRPLLHPFAAHRIPSGQRAVHGDYGASPISCRIRPPPTRNRQLSQPTTPKHTGPPPVR